MLLFGPAAIFCVGYFGVFPEYWTESVYVCVCVCVCVCVPSSHCPFNRILSVRRRKDTNLMKNITKVLHIIIIIIIIIIFIIIMIYYKKYYYDN